ncbi:phenazine-specific anthranilate synthase component I [Spongiactinospora gelatinilytica]|uniref:anthranilate synthase n=1 Tax=Spongiactinospora gelatinilytica TaxID=2666298 RepID=A0A2W2FIG7_9ACTN|nr:anthranilate synthase family protein [Spongiactinospora gelatinilytica]PZG35442.1 phenazine-specific anthranilate synthase component I [Spongiactinospora gelatinilytica]
MTGPLPGVRTEGDLLATVVDLQATAFALLHRPEANRPDLLDVLIGEVTTVTALADIPLPRDPAPADGGPRHEVLALIPYRQIRERGFICADDGAPLIAMIVTGQRTVPIADALARIPDLPIAVSEGRFDVADDDYAETVRRVIKEAIGEGEGANFVIKRSFVVEIDGYTPRSAMSLFRRLLQMESGAYWTFIVHTGTRTFVGASPERHITLNDGVVTMNPISGTYRYPPSGPTLPGVMDFLADRKESDELYMVVDEELKMMTRICEPGVRVVGPRLKEMSRLAHTEYVIEGDSRWDVRDILRESMFAPTVTGSPLENACRVIGRHEPQGRGYYSGVAALIGRDANGERTLDSSILIRTADIDSKGQARIGVGATLVRHSDPLAEVAETNAKAAGLLAALRTTQAERLGTHPDVRDALERRNATIAGFWLGSTPGRTPGIPRLAGRRTLIIDAEDTFTSMLDHQLRSLDMPVTVRGHGESLSFEGYDFVVLGPGPGDPRDETHPKIAYLRAAVDALLRERRPFLAVCLSHQVLSIRLGFEVRRKEAPNQGLQMEIDLFGEPERVGFYNTFAARSELDTAAIGGVGTVRICRDPVTGEVHALHGPRFSSLQFHAESVLTQNGPRILGSSIERALST